MTRRRTLTVLGVAAVVVALDALTKLLTVTRLEDQPLDLGWVVLRSGRNTGISFSLGADLAPWIVMAGTGAAVLLIIVLALRGTVHPASAAGLLVGGGLGNWLDRLGDGAVVDMVDLGWFPVFNLADVALNLGVVLVLLDGLLHGDPAEDADAGDAPAEEDPAGDTHTGDGPPDDDAARAAASGPPEHDA